MLIACSLIPKPKAVGPGEIRRQPPLSERHSTRADARASGARRPNVDRQSNQIVKVQKGLQSSQSWFMVGSRKVESSRVGSALIRSIVSGGAFVVPIAVQIGRGLPLEGITRDATIAGGAQAGFEAEHGRAAWQVVHSIVAAERKPQRVEHLHHKLHRQRVRWVFRSNRGNGSHRGGSAHPVEGGIVEQPIEAPCGPPADPRLSKRPCIGVVGSEPEQSAAATRRPTT